MSYIVKKELKFDAAHRLVNYSGKCKDLHGHSYRVIVELVCKELDKRGLGVDFGEIKMLFQGWLDDNWDHNVILCVDDSLCQLLTSYPSYREPYLLKGNPTAEVMASHLLNRFQALIFDADAFEGASVGSVEVFETATSSCKVSV